MTEHESKRTTNHAEIRRWVEERGGHPASVRGTSGDGARLLRIDFDGHGAGEEQLEPISWDELFREFDARELDLPGGDDERRGQPLLQIRRTRVKESLGRWLSERGDPAPARPRRRTGRT